VVRLQSAKKRELREVWSELAIVENRVLILAKIAGFLGTRASLMLDVVFLAMFLVVPLLAVSVWLVKRGRYAAHKRMQLLLGTTLLLIVAAFEIDIRFFTDWEKLAEPSPYYRVNAWNTVWTALSIHLAFAIPATFLWGYVIVQALRKFPDPPRPGPYSRAHKRWAWLAAGTLVMTAITGSIFYYLAFVA
jgi:uncharacterized membrane protein YozB (DUF420 family)